jgi:dynein heavy chain
VILENESPLELEFPPIILSNSEELSVNNFIKLIVVKFLAPNKFLMSIRKLIILEMGSNYLNPPLFDIERSFEDSSSTVPLIFVLPGADPLVSLTSFARRKKKLETLKQVSLGQG